MEYGMRNGIENREWNMECGMRNVECGMWNVERAMWLVQCAMEHGIAI